MPRPSAMLRIGRWLKNTRHVAAVGALVCDQTRLVDQRRDGAESAQGISPRAAHRSGLDTLASSGSCHRAKGAAFRRELELLLLPVGSLPTWVTCPLRSTGITPLHNYYGAVRPWPTHRYFRPRSFAACTFPLASPDRFSSSVREPERESCLLYTGHRVANK